MPGSEVCFHRIVPLGAMGVRGSKKDKMTEEQALERLPELWTRAARSELGRKERFLSLEVELARLGDALISEGEQGAKNGPQVSGTGG